MKNQLKACVLFLTLGIVFVVLAFNFPNISIFVGFAGACFGPMVFILFKYLYWRKRPEQYREKQQNANIELFDERKEMIRGKALRVSTLISWAIMSGCIITIALLGQFEVVPNAIARYVVIGIALYWFVSIIVMQVVYKILNIL